MNRNTERQVGFDLIKSLPKADLEQIAQLTAQSCNVEKVRIYIEDSEMENFFQCGNTDTADEEIEKQIYRKLHQLISTDFFQLPGLSDIESSAQTEITGLKTPYFAALPFAAEFPNIQGIICISDKNRKTLNSSEEKAFQLFAVQCERLIEYIRMERRNQKLMERLEVATKLGQVGYWELDLKTHEVVWSEEFSQILALNDQLDSLKFEFFSQFLESKDRQKFEEKINLILSGKLEKLDVKHRVQLQNGNIKWLHQQGHLVCGNDGKPLVFRGTSQDITDTQNKAQSIAHHMEFIETTLDNIPLGIIVNRISDRKVTFINPRFTALMGWRLEDVGDILDILDKAIPDPELKQKYFQRVDDYLNNGSSTILEWKEVVAHTKQGERLILNINTFPLYDQDLVISTIVDESEAYRTKEALRNVNKRYEYVSKATWDTIYDWDIAKNALYWGQNYTQNLGYVNHDDTKINFEEWSARLHPEDNDRVQESLKQALNGNVLNWSSYYRFKHAEGHYLRLQDRGFIIRDNNGKAIRMVGAMQDVSREYEKEKQLELYASAIKNTKDAILITEAKKDIPPAEYPIIFANQAYEHLSGYSFEELRGQPPIILHGPLTDTLAITKALKNMDDTQPADVDIVNYKKNGESYWVNLSISPVLDQHKSITHYISIQREISMRKAEQINRDLIQQVSQIFSRAISAAETLEHVIRSLGKTLKVQIAELWLFEDHNLQLELSSCYTEDQAYTDFCKAATKIDFSKDDALFSEILHQISNICLTDIGESSSGFHRCVQANKAGLEVAYGIPLFAEKKIIGVLAIFTGKDYGFNEELMDRQLRDMPYYLGSEIRRKILLEQLELIFASVPDIICTADSQGFIKKINRSVTENFGYQDFEVIGKHFADFVYPPDLEKAIEEFKNVVAGNATPYFEIRYMTKTGEPRWLAWSINVPDEGGDIFCVAKDITDKKSIENELLFVNHELSEKNKLLAASNTELEHFAYVASHDLQEPLRMIGSFLTQLDKKYRDQLDSRAQTYINYAVDGAKRMRVLIQELLDYSRVGQFEDAKEEVLVQDVIDEIGTLYNNVLSEQRAELVIAGTLPKVFTVRVLLSQVLQNLIDNALKYSRDDIPPHITISSSENDKYWMFTVTDNGIGIEEQYLDKIFVIFQRLHSKDAEGSGMGLTITKKIVEKLGGTIMVESQLGNGSTFTFTIRKPHEALETSFPQ